MGGGGGLWSRPQPESVVNYLPVTWRRHSVLHGRSNSGLIGLLCVVPFRCKISRTQLSLSVFFLQTSYTFLGKKTGRVRRRTLLLPRGGARFALFLKQEEGREGRSKSAPNTYRAFTRTPLPAPTLRSPLCFMCTTQGSKFRAWNKSSDSAL